MFKKLLGWIRWLFILAWLLLVITISAWIAFENMTPVRLNLFGFQLPEATMGLYLSWTFVAGVTLGWFGTWLLARIKLFSRQRELGKVKKEVDKLRTAHLQEQ